MVCMGAKKLFTGIFLGVCLLAMGVAPTAQAQSFSAKGIVSKNMFEEICASEIEQLILPVQELTTAGDDD